MYNLSEQMAAQLKQAGFTDRQISDHRVKFYNLLAILPMPTKSIEQYPQCGFTQWRKDSQLARSLNG
jgi:hypothetical protein